MKAEYIDTALKVLMNYRKAVIHSFNGKNSDIHKGVFCGTEKTLYNGTSKRGWQDKDLVCHIACNIRLSGFYQNL